MYKKHIDELRMIKTQILNNTDMNKNELMKVLQRNLKELLNLDVKKLYLMKKRNNKTHTGENSMKKNENNKNSFENTS